MGRFCGKLRKKLLLNNEKMCPEAV